MQWYPKWYPDVTADRVEKIPVDQLVSWGIQGLILDIDNTLTTHDNPIPQEGVADWLDSLRNKGIKLIVLSNNKPERVAPFAEILHLEYISNGKKPLTGGYRRCSDALRLPLYQLCMVGDQLFTDVWGGNRAGCKTILVQPIQTERMWFFRLKRMLERYVMYFCPQKVKESILHID